LRAYYNNINFENRDNVTLKVQGHGEMSLETYLLGVCEMPESWPMEALKAQVIAARSYALAYTNNGANEICTTESCQVYCGEKTGQWRTAVQETAGKTMIQNGSPIKAWFSSTHGGYVFSSGEIGWSSTDWTKHANDFDGSVGSFDELKNKAYDRESPWFYCDWGSRNEYNKTAWLKPEELADIVNVILLARKDSSTRSHLYQPDKSNPEGTDTWDAGRVRQELGSAAYSTVDNVTVSADFGYGRSTSVSVSGSGHNDSFSMNEFKDFFNLRAPANIQIVGPLFNVEKR
jgi:SpoIID/LytB domain protein